MSGQIREAVTRQVDAVLDRRTTVLGIGLGTIATVATGLADALARKNNKRKKRKKRRDRKRNNGPPSCAERCPDQFEQCVERAADSTLCAVGVEAADVADACVPCSSDQDCLAIDPFNNAFPYCVPVNGVTERATGEVDLTLALACGLANDAVCATVGSGR